MGSRMSLMAGALTVFTNSIYAVHSFCSASNSKTLKNRYALAACDGEGRRLVKIRMIMTAVITAAVDHLDTIQVRLALVDKYEVYDDAGLPWSAR